MTHNIIGGLEAPHPRAFNDIDNACDSNNRSNIHVSLKTNQSKVITFSKGLL